MKLTQDKIVVISPFPPTEQNALLRSVWSGDGQNIPRMGVKCGTEDTKWVDHPDQWLGFCGLPAEGLK
jgi:hypothetical protein